MSNLFGLSNATAAYIPQAKAWGLGGKIDNATFLRCFQENRERSSLLQKRVSDLEIYPVFTYRSSGYNTVIF